MTTVINFFGGPAAGKTTSAHKLFTTMKEHRINCEIAHEFAKELVWQKSESIKDQFFVVGTQYHRQYQLLHKVDYIICDSPILLSIPYIWYSDRNVTFNDDCHAMLTKNWKQAFEDFVVKSHHTFKNINLYVDRAGRKYAPEGRLESEEDAKAIDKKVLKLLNKYQIEYDTITSDDNFIQIMENIIS